MTYLKYASNEVVARVNYIELPDGIAIFPSGIAVRTALLSRPRGLLALQATSCNSTSRVRQVQLSISIHICIYIIYIYIFIYVHMCIYIYIYTSVAKHI